MRQPWNKNKSVGQKKATPIILDFKDYLLVPDTEVSIYLEGKNLFIKCPRCKTDMPHERFLENEIDKGVIEIVHISEQYKILDDFEWNCRGCGVSHKYEMDLAMNSDRMKEEYKQVISHRLINLIESNDSYQRAINNIINLSTLDD
jgi:hypothetical protein